MENSVKNDEKFCGYEILENEIYKTIYMIEVLALV